MRLCRGAFSDASVPLPVARSAPGAYAPDSVARPEPHPRRTEPAQAAPDCSRPFQTLFVQLHLRISCTFRSGGRVRHACIWACTCPFSALVSQGTPQGGGHSAGSTSCASSCGCATSLAATSRCTAARAPSSSRPRVCASHAGPQHTLRYPHSSLRPACRRFTTSGVACTTSPHRGKGARTGTLRQRRTGGSARRACCATLCLLRFRYIASHSAYSHTCHVYVCSCNLHSLSRPSWEVVERVMPALMIPV